MLMLDQGVVHHNIFKIFEFVRIMLIRFFIRLDSRRGKS